MAGDIVGLSIYLLKQGSVAEFEEAILTAAEDRLVRLADLDGYLRSLPSIPREPAWAAILRSISLDAENVEIRTQSPGALLVVRREGRTFVVSFGTAWLRLKDEWLERDFGRRVALNLIARDQVVEIRAEQVFARWHLASERAPRASSVDEFGVEFDRDLVASVEGVPSDKTFGKLVRGGVGLRADGDVSRLGHILDTAFELYRSDDYRRQWPEIDNLTPVVEQPLIERLEGALGNDLATKQASRRIVMFTPAQRDGELVTAESYVFGRMSKNLRLTPYLRIEALFNYLDREGLERNVAVAKRIPVHLLDEANDEITQCSAFSCFGYETTVDGKQYVLSSGTWYEVVASFVDKINSTIRQIRTPRVKLPRWDEVETEGQYNLRCTKENKHLLHFDRRSIRFGGGRSQFELCDLMHPDDKTLMFAKIASKSSGMSHLCEQVRRTAEMLYGPDPAYRSELIRVFKDHYPSADRRWLKERPRPGDWDLCLVSLGRRKEELPFFAKCGLAKLHTDLYSRGHNVSFIAV